MTVLLGRRWPQLQDQGCEKGGVQNLQCVASFVRWVHGGEGAQNLAFRSPESHSMAPLPWNDFSYLHTFLGSPPPSHPREMTLFTTL